MLDIEGVKMAKNNNKSHKTHTKTQCKTIFDIKYYELVVNRLEVQRWQM